MVIINQNNSTSSNIKRSKIKREKKHQSITKSLIFSLHESQNFLMIIE